MNNRLSFHRQDNTREAAESHEKDHLNLALNLRLKPFATLTGTGSYHYYRDDNSRSGTTTTHNAKSGARWSVYDNLELSGTIHGENHRGGSLSRTHYGLNGSVRHLRSLPLGQMRTGYSLRHDRYEQEASTTTGEVIGERIVLSGTQASPLSLPEVIPASVVVSNATRTQVYQENLDYALTTVGQTTRVQRLVGGRIQDGEEVLVDYQHQVGGTFSHARTDHDLNLEWLLSQRVSIFLRHSRSSAEVLSGTPAVPLNEKRSTLFGARSAFSVNPGIPLTVGGRIERERVENRVSPLQRQSLDLYLRTEKPLFNLGFLNLSFRHLALDYENSVHDVDLLGYGVKFTTRLFGGALTVASNYERDRGGSVTRDRRKDTVDYECRVNKLTFSGLLSRRQESQGQIERKNTLVQLSLRRDF
ncbi:MAG: hypothetical protein GWN87_18605 [Desulfuromonadales bacterium]|nr:hypothetical protein [Desulfuromonadales bacterium]NIS41364.1 hypothetical protein [Desulfuromonadales bacterium]